MKREENMKFWKKKNSMLEIAWNVKKTWNFEKKKNSYNFFFFWYRFQLSPLHLLFGETTSHLTSKWRGTFQYYFFLMLKIA